MLAKRIIPCLDVRDGQVVKGVRFREHEVVGDIVTLAQAYSKQGADELVFYDITASSEHRTVDCEWITQVARCINIPFCVAGGIRDVETARKILQAGADKISINSPALENPALISAISAEFGQQCMVVGVDSFAKDNDYYVYQYTGSEQTSQQSEYRTVDWLQKVQALGAGEVVLNCMNQDGVRQGYDVQQLFQAREILTIPLIASGGAGCKEHFSEVFQKANVDGALAASVFHRNQLTIPELKAYLRQCDVEVRL